MTFNELKNYPAIKTAHQISLRVNKPVYLAGGTLRDSMTGCFNGSDFDFVLEDNFDDFIKTFSKMVKGKIIPWDFNQTRIVYKEKSRNISVDFSLLKGEDIISDLKLRDFTINSMAVDLKSLMSDDSPVIIDPLNGRRDFINKKIKISGESAFGADPLRILRGIRFARNLGFSIDRETFEIMEQNSFLIKKVSSERIKKEFFTIFGLPNINQSIRELCDTGIFSKIIPELNDFYYVIQGYPHSFNLFDHSVKTVDMLDDKLNYYTDITNIYKDNIINYFNQKIEEGVTRRSLLMFAGLFHDIGKTITRKEINGRITFYGHAGEGAALNNNIAKRMGLGRHAQNIIKMITENHMRIFQLSQLNEITERAINRFIKDVDEVSLEVIFLAVADVMATGTGDTCASTIESVNNLAAVLIDRIFSPNNVLEKDAVITGSEVMNILSIPEGPEVGNILREISERERTGVFKSREDAIKWIMEKKKPH